jgi:hypothetical protein
MINRILDLFPTNTHPIILVSDPDHLLAGESILVALAARGYQIIDESDPVVLRYQIEQVKPFSSERPVIVTTEKIVEELPFDLWQQAHRIRLSLHPFFPNLAYPILHSLTPTQLEILMDCRQPTERLGRLGTIDYILKNVFSLDVLSHNK